MPPWRLNGPPRWSVELAAARIFGKGAWA